MKIADIMSKNLEWLTEGDSVQKAATIMAKSGVSFRPVCDMHNRVIGLAGSDGGTQAVAV